MIETFIVTAMTMLEARPARHCLFTTELACPSWPFRKPTTKRPTRRDGSKRMRRSSWAERDSLTIGKTITGAATETGTTWAEHVTRVLQFPALLFASAES